jgi:hypothetical protein
VHCPQQGRHPPHLWRRWQLSLLLLSLLFLLLLFLLLPGAWWRQG